MTDQIEQAEIILAKAKIEAAAVLAKAKIDTPTVEHFSRDDRDLLITMHEQIKNVRVDIKELSDGTAKQLTDHESRLRVIEKDAENIVLLKRITYGAVALVLTAVFSAIIYLVVSHT